MIFTLVIALILAGALVTAWGWPLRASIIILVLGSIGLILVGTQLALDIRNGHDADANKLDFELPSFTGPDAKAFHRGTLEIWSWLFGLLIAIKLIGLPIALPIFVFAYAKVYGASWVISTVIAALIAAFEYGIYERIVHVYWPEPYLLELLGLFG